MFCPGSEVRYGSGCVGETRGAMLAAAVPEVAVASVPDGEDVQRSGVCAVDDSVSGSISPTRPIRKMSSDRRLVLCFIVRDACVSGGCQGS